MQWYTTFALVTFCRLETSIFLDSKIAFIQCMAKRFMEHSNCSDKERRRKAAPVPLDPVAHRQAEATGTKNYPLTGAKYMHHHRAV